MTLYTLHMVKVRTYMTSYTLHMVNVHTRLRSPFTWSIYCIFTGHWMQADYKPRSVRCMTVYKSIKICTYVDLHMDNDTHTQHT
jgi:hypothetical protein